MSDSLWNRDPFLLRLTVSDLPKMTNQLASKHWRVRHKHSKRWRELIAWLSQSAIKSREGLPLERAKITLTRFSSIRPDYDGLVSGFKPIIDGLVDAGVIPNDTQDVIGKPDYRHEMTKPKQGKITIEVSEAL